MKREIVNPLIKDRVRFIKTAQESGGVYTEVEVTLMPDGGTPLHFHRKFSEGFTAIEGILGLELKNKKQILLKPGEKYFVPMNVLHRFHNPTKSEIKFNVLIQPASEGFEYALRIMYGLAADGLTNKNSLPKSFAHTSILLSMGDNHAPGLLTLLSPLLKWSADKARKKGIEKELIEKYCI